MTNALRRLGELGLIERIRALAEGTRVAGVRVGIGDDCAVLRVPRGHEMVVTTDFSLEGRHFRRDWQTAESVGHRCLARGLSDVAAMGAKPLGAFLSLALPREYELAWVDGFVAGFAELARRWEVQLAGGDTAQAPGSEILADVVVTGSVRAGRALLRTGAGVGDRIYVTGRLGGAAVELEGMAARVLGGRGRQSFREPRVGVGLALVRRRLATACMDLSDGLSTDLTHLCRASRVGAELTGVPVAEGATLEQALHGGEDYELLFTAARETRVPKRIAGVQVTDVGKIVAGEGARVDGVEMKPRGWEHLSG